MIPQFSLGGSGVLAQLFGNGYELGIVGEVKVGVVERGHKSKCERWKWFFDFVGKRSSKFPFFKGEKSSSKSPF